MSLITSISLITAFFGGMVALFAPCCITFLLPSYLANIFREKGRVVWMTLIFGLGITTVLVPVALGIRAVGMLFQTYHTQTYVIGGIFMILLGVMEITGKKITLPMLNLTIDVNKHHDPWSIYFLGIFSGLTTSCCTPVLAGVLTVSFLSPNLIWAGLAGLSYVFGMVIPLVVLALVLEKVNWKALSGVKRYSDKVAGVLYIAVGIIFSVLALTGRISMGTEQSLNLGFVTWLRSIPYGEYGFAILLVLSLYWLIQKGRRTT